MIEPGEASFLSYSHFFKENVISTWSSGTGAAGVVGAGSYALLTTLGLHPRYKSKISSEFCPKTHHKRKQRFEKLGQDPVSNSPP